MNKTSFGSLSGILAWTGRNEIHYMDNSDKLPYVLHKGQFHYFAFDGQKYNLVMVSGTDLNERKA